MPGMRSFPPILLVALALATTCAGTLWSSDCNRNGLPDDEELLSGHSDDCNQNFVPDDCDVLPQSAAFEPVSTARTGDRPYGAVAVDLDRDGDNDLVIANQDSNDATILRNEGAAGFQWSATLPTGRQPLGLAAGDLDGDGDDDVVLSCFSDATLLILKSDGAGTLPGSTVDSRVGLCRLVLSDLDADGHLDLAGTDSSAYVHIFLNDGGGALLWSRSVFTGNEAIRPKGIAAGDIDGDGDVDLCTANSATLSGRGVSVLLNDGTGGFSLDAAILEAGFHPFAVALGDLDGDEDLDLIVANSGSDNLSVFLNLGGGTFGAPRVFPPRTPTFPPVMDLRQVLCADFTGDGFLDAIVADAGRNERKGGLLLFVGTGDGRFLGPSAFLAGDKPSDLVILGASVAEPGRVVTVNWLSNDISILEHAIVPGSLDCDINGVPDECDPDCDRDGIPDPCEIANGTAFDSNANGIPDGCEEDCNQNGILDEVDIADGTSKDCNDNLIPDACDVAPTLGFASAMELTVGGYPADVVAADFDGDEIQDLAVIVQDSEDLVVLANVGGRSFHESRRYFAGLHPAALASGDFDRDGDIDLVVASSRSMDIALFRNNGHGKFLRGAPMPGIESPGALEAADLDGDGDPDLLLGSTTDHVVRLYWNNGGSFEPPVELSVLVIPTHIAALDLDGDADLDLVIGVEALGAPIELVFNLGGRVFDVLSDGDAEDPILVTATASGAALVAGDLDGDGDIDLVVAEKTGGALATRVVVLLDDGSGHLERGQVLEPSGGMFGLALADVDQDQDSDLIVAGENVNIFVNDGAGGFTHRGSFRTPGVYKTVVAADLDGDLVLDVVAPALPDKLMILWNRGDGRSEVVNTYATGQQTASVVIDDFDMDGDFDVAAAAPLVSRLTILENAGDGLFSSTRSLDQLGSSSRLLSGDFNGDGAPDLLGVVSGQQVGVFLNSGDGSFTTRSDYQAAESISDIASGDLDADGDLDLAIASHDSPELTLLLNAGDGSFESSRTVPVGSGQSALLAADLNADGLVDLVVSTEGAQIQPGLHFLWSLGPAEFTPSDDAPDYPILNKASALVAADVDNDGKVEVVWADKSESSVSALRILGEMEFELLGPFPAGDEPVVLAVGDLDRDGYQDIVVGSADSRFLHVLRNDGQGSFGVAQPFPAGGSQRSIALGYLDGDGDLDVAVAFWEQGEVGIFFNQAAEAPAMDCDRNGVADMFQLGASRDCNGNDIPDTIDIHARRSLDENRDGLPDECQGGRPIFHRGDANADGRLDISDGLFTLGFLFLGTSPPSCLESADVNNDARMDITDGIAILSFLFLGLGPPAPPGPPPGVCGADADAPGSAGDLGCSYYAPCG